MKTDDINEIRELLSKYYDGKTTQEEERFLVKFFSEDCHVLTGLESDRELFVSMSCLNDDVDIPADLEQKLNGHIDRLDRTEHRHKVSRIKRYVMIAAAASVVIAIALGAYFSYGPISPTPSSDAKSQLIAANTPRQDEVTDVDIAYKNTEMALLMLSTKLNQSSQGIAIADEKINNINEKLNTILK